MNFLNCGSLLSDDSRLCQVDIKIIQSRVYLGCLASHFANIGLISKWERKPLENTQEMKEINWYGDITGFSVVGYSKVACALIKP